jgi:hypothetical protein
MMMSNTESHSPGNFQHSVILSHPECCALSKWAETKQMLPPPLEADSGYHRMSPT